VNLHKIARTTPEIRREIQPSSLSERVLARKYGVSRPKIRKWASREGVLDRSCRQTDEAIERGKASRKEILAKFPGHTRRLP
jgi:hypothetical protein